MINDLFAIHCRSHSRIQSSQNIYATKASAINLYRYVPWKWLSILLCSYISMHSAFCLDDTTNERNIS